MAYRVTIWWGFQPLRDFGWSENFYTADSSFATATASSAILRGALGAIHGRQTLYQATRVTKLDDVTNIPVRLSSLDEPTSSLGFNSAVPFSYSTDYPTTAIAIRAQYTDGKISTQWLKGIPDGVFEAGQPLGSGLPDFTARIDAFMSVLNSGASPWRMRLLSGASVNQHFTSFDWTIGQVTIPNHGFTAGQLIGVKGARGVNSEQINGRWRVEAPTANTFFLAGFSATTMTPALTNGCVAYNVTYGLYKANWSVLRVSKRNVGRPFGSTSGRRKTRR